MASETSRSIHSNRSTTTRDNYSAVTDTENDSDSDSEDIEIPHIFQESVVKYVKIDDMIKTKQAEIRELRKLLKPCEEVIISFLKENNQPEVQITQGKLKSDTKETRSPLTMSIIRKAILTKLGDEKLTDEILLLMDELRVKRVKVSLKRQKA